MSDAAYEELVLAVRQNPDAYIDSDAERAFALLGQAMRKFNESARDDDLLDDDQYMAARNKRFEALRGACQAALSLDTDCLDAQLLLALATVGRPDKLLDALCELEEKCPEEPAFAQLDWGNPWDRARLRLRAAISRTCADCACWKMALETANSVLEVTESVGDPLGARRSLRGFAQLNRGAAYAMMRPVFVEVYLPDRPDYAPGCFEEAMAAVHEAEVIIADTPDFVAWCQTLDWFEADARAYAEKHDLDW